MGASFHQRRQIRVAILALVMLLGLVTGGCGSSSSMPDVATLRGTDQAAAARQLARDADASGTGSDATSGATPEEAILRFTKCLRDNGLDVPDPDVDSAGNLQLDFGSGADLDPKDPQVKRARDRCSKYANAIIQSFDPDDIVAIRDTLVKYAACLRRAGYPVRDPQFFNAKGPFPDVRPDDPKFMRANTQCEPVLAGIAKVLNG